MAEDENVDGNIPHAETLRKHVNEAVKTIEGSGEIRKRIISTLANDIIDERIAKLHKALAKREEMKKNLYKIRPDQVSLTAEGEKASETYSKPKYEELKKAKEELDKIDRAIGKAIDNSNYDDIQKFI